jgi:hypothetical protein
MYERQSQLGVELGASPPFSFTFTTVGSYGFTNLSASNTVPRAYGILPLDS